IGAIPAAYALVVRWGLPESVRWLEAKGRLTEADAIVKRFEKESAPVAPAPERARATLQRSSVADLFRAGLAPRTFALWAVWAFVNFSYYGAFIWIPSILVAQGFDLVHSF